MGCDSLMKISIAPCAVTVNEHLWRKHLWLPLCFAAQVDDKPKLRRLPIVTMSISILEVTQPISLEGSLNYGLMALAKTA